MTDVGGRIEAMLQQADQAARSGQVAQAVGIYQQVLTLAPEHPRALNGLGNRALSSGDAQAARDFFTRALARDPAAGPIWLNLSAAQRLLGDGDGELAALDGALAADPYFVIALLQKAQFLERHDRREEALRAYRALLSAAPPLDTLPDPLRQALAHGQALIDAADRRIEQAIRDAVGDAAHGSPRFDRAVAVLGGRSKIHLPKPVGLHYPFLPADEYFDRALFPWFDALEAATDTIREELRGLLSRGGHGQPYVSIARGVPENQWRELNNSLDWSAIFVWKDGRPVKDVVAHCPRTAALLSSLPMLDIPGRGPTAMFSTLRPRTRIPPHHGVTNIRAVVHLPLIVPAGCGFRVGGETREWTEGCAWAFDDTIEHEAWNDGDETRVILIIDAWNPYLDERERALLRTANAVLGGVDAAAI